jgi:hypothetical protein
MNMMDCPRRRKTKQYVKYWMKVLEDKPKLFTKITASLNKRIFSESANKQEDWNCQESCKVKGRQ